MSLPSCLSSHRVTEYAHVWDVRCSAQMLITSVWNKQWRLTALGHSGEVVCIFCCSSVFSWLQAPLLLWHSSHSQLYLKFSTFPSLFFIKSNRLSQVAAVHTFNLISALERQRHGNYSVIASQPEWVLEQHGYREEPCLERLKKKSNLLKCLKCFFLK